MILAEGEAKTEYAIAADIVSAMNPHGWRAQFPRGHMLSFSYIHPCVGAYDSVYMHIRVCRLDECDALFLHFGTSANFRRWLNLWILAPFETRSTES